MRRRRPALLVALSGLLVALTAGCGATGDPRLELVGEARASAAQAGSAQVVLTVANTGDGDDVLVGADTEQAAAVEIHRTTLDGGRATMETLEALEVPAGGEIRFRPGQEHLMLVVPDETVVEGGTLTLVLRFERSDPLTVEAPVVDLLDLVEDTLDEDAG